MTLRDEFIRLAAAFETRAAELRALAAGGGQPPSDPPDVRLYDPDPRPPRQPELTFPDIVGDPATLTIDRFGDLHFWSPNGVMLDRHLAGRVGRTLLHFEQTGGLPRG